MPCPTDPVAAAARGDRPAHRHAALRGRSARACPSPIVLRIAAWLGAGLPLLLAGCTLMPPAPAPAPALPPPPAAPASVPPPPAPVAPPPPAAPAPAEAALQQLLGWHERSRGLGAAELAREQARLAGLAGAGSDEATLKLAWLLGQGRAPGDLARALALLEPLARGEPVEVPLSPLARLLQARLAEQRRLEEQLERQAQQQRELQRRNDQLREQLDALRAIERSLGPRPAAPAPR